MFSQPDGLLGVGADSSMLVAKRTSDNARVVASEVDRGPEFRCPDAALQPIGFHPEG